MGIFSWIVLGLIVGVAAKLIMPGRDPGGLLVTIAIGMAGAFIGGYSGTMLGIGGVDGFDLRSLALATAGAVLLLAAYRVSRRRM
ncbi:MAG: GlsB/YeaQ/YmgE family stress response membrane protein [Pseudomonadales bacterium]